MFKYLITHWPELNTMRHDYIHNYLALRVELISGERRWYRVGPKLYTAISLYKKQHGHLPYKMLRNAYINVPVTPYFNHNKAGIAESMTSAKTLKLLMNKIFALATLKIALEKQMEANL